MIILSWTIWLMLELVLIPIVALYVISQWLDRHALKILIGAVLATIVIGVYAGIR